MRKQLTLTVAVLAIAFAGVAMAGDYHSDDTLICSQCHVMHASQQHGYDPDGGGSFGAVGAPTEGLLRDEINALCLSCHDGQSWAADVMELPSTAIVRAAGGLNSTTSTGDYNPASGHTLGSDAIAPGGDFENANGLSCVDCHQQHGYAGGANSWRNLYTGYGNPVITYETAATPTGDFDVTQLAIRDYTNGNLTFNKTTASPTTSAYADYCKACHTDFHGAVTGTEIGGTLAGGHFIRHPAAEVIIGSIGGGHSDDEIYTTIGNNVPVQTDGGTNLTPSCFSCHKGHGNQNAFGLIFMAGTGTITEEGDDGASAKDLCSQCHVQ